MWHESPVHEAFGLTYASYFVLPRVLMEAMPLGWQQRFVALADEFNEAWEGYEPAGGYAVQARDETGRYGTDPLREYRHPDRAFIDSLRRAVPA